MDNVTHALAGMLLADVALLAVTPRDEPIDPRFRRRARWASALANNLPDLDGLLRNVTPGRLGYLLHHRGHSHTFGVTLVLGALCFCVLRALWRKPTGAPAGRERWTLFALCLVGGWVHVAMDFSNNYGVHPFWPLYDGWLYGDAVFIIEPLFWVLTIPALALASQHRATKLLLFGIVAIGVVLAWVTEFANRGTALFLTLLTVVFVGLNLQLAQRTRTLVAFGGALATAGVFLVASRVARTAVVEAAHFSAPKGAAPIDLADMSLAPAPSNPFCWSAMAVGQRGDRYGLWVATVTLAPGLVPKDGCRVEPTGRTLALQVASLESTPIVRWDGEWTAPLDALGALARTNCEASAYLRWARLPFWVQRGRELVLGDLRYDRSPELDFAEIVGTSPPSTCPKRVPPWIPPRAALIDPR